LHILFSMFRKRIKKQFPPGTFIPTPARVCAIIQLCMAFSVLLWNASEPFIGEIFNVKSNLLLYQDVMGTDHFKTLPEQTQKSLLQNYEALQKQLQRSFWDKLKSVFDLFAYKISPWEIAWMVFSIAIAIMLLKRVEGASQAVWLLPVLIACYAADTRLYTKENPGSAEHKLFPTEKEIVENYLQGPLSEDIFDQQKELMEGWKRYLIIKWAHQAPSEVKEVFDKQAGEGAFRFNLARLDLHTKQGNVSIPASPALWQLILYFFWNTYFAYTAWKHTKIWSAAA
jgi:hypothetical protein